VCTIFNILKKKIFFFSFSGRTDIGLFNIEIPQNVIGVLMTVNIILIILNFSILLFE